MTTETIALGLSGFAGVGKTEAAKYLMSEYGFVRAHMAEPMRGMLATLMRYNGIDDVMIERYLTGDLKDGVVIPEFGKTSRDMQISLGTSWGRKCVSYSLWVDTWKRMTQGIPRVLNDSVRFENEERAIRDMGGSTILIERPGFGPVKFQNGLGKWLYKVTGSVALADESERVDRLDPDVTLVNDLGIGNLRWKIDAQMQDWGIEPLSLSAGAVRSERRSLRSA